MLDWGIFFWEQKKLSLSLLIHNKERINTIRRTRLANNNHITTIRASWMEKSTKRVAFSKACSEVNIWQKSIKIDEKNVVLMMRKDLFKKKVSIEFVLKNFWTMSVYHFYCKIGCAINASSNWIKEDNIV